MNQGNQSDLLRVGLLGCGVVGSEVARLLAANQSDFASRSGAALEITKIAVRTIKDRPGIDKSLFTTDAQSVVNDPEIDVIIEVMGGIDEAKDLLFTAIKNGKSVITANKALLAKHGNELFHAADDAGVDFYYEAEIGRAHV